MFIVKGEILFWAIVRGGVEGMVVVMDIRDFFFIRVVSKFKFSEFILLVIVLIFLVIFFNIVFR